MPDTATDLGPLDAAEVEFLMQSRQQQLGTMVSPVRPGSSAKDATVLADIVPNSNRKRKTSDVSRSFPRDVPGELVMNQSYQNARTEANRAREATNQAERNADTVKSAIEYLKSNKIINNHSVEEKQEEIYETERKLRAMKEEAVQCLRDDGLGIDDQIANSEGLMMSREADVLRKQADLAGKIQRRECLQFLMLRRQHSGLRSTHLQDCTKDQLRDLFKVESTGRVAFFGLIEMNQIFNDLCFGGYNDLKDEWKERMAHWTFEDWQKVGGTFVNHKWMKSMFLEIFGFAVEDQDNWLNQTGSAPSL